MRHIFLDRRRIQRQNILIRKRFFERKQSRRGEPRGSPAIRSHGLSAGAAAQSFLLRAMSAQGHRHNSGDINLTDMRDRGEGDMDEFTAKTNEIRRLHKVCRAKNAAVRQAYQSQVNCARGVHRL